MAIQALTHRFLRLHLGLALALVLAASIFGWSIDRAKHNLMIEKSELSETLYDALQAMTVAVVSLHSIQQATSAGIASTHKEKLREPATELDAAMDAIAVGLTEGRLSHETKAILENEVLDPMGLMEDFGYIAHVVATQPDLWGERAARHLNTANSIVAHVLPTVSRISAIEQADLQADLVSYARWRMIAVGLVAVLLAVIWVVIFLPLERGIMRAQGELAGQFARAEAASRAKSDFLATMSHEVRTPLNGVLGMAEQLGTTRINDEQREMLDDLRGSGQALLTIIDDVLDLSRIEAGKLKVDLQPTDIRGVLRSLERFFAPAAGERGISLTVHVDEAVASRHLTDGGRLRQILTNLVSNAIKFTSQGSVTIGLRADAVAGGVQRLRFVVEDTGIGLAPTDRERIFEPFEQADSSTTRRFGGTGLGLAISRRLADSLGGLIAVESEPGRGSAFSLVLDLPTAPNDALPEAPRDDACPPPRFDGMRVLVAEDNRVNSSLLSRILERNGCTVAVAVNGDEAVRMWREMPFDIVFMDISMPGKDGFAAAAEIRAHEEATGQPPLPIVALTAHLGERYEQRCLGVGMQAVLTKPFNRAAIVAAIEDLALHKRSIGDTAA